MPKKRIIISGLIAAVSLVIVLILRESYLTKNKQAEIYTNDQGQPLYSTGNCNSSSDCFPSGCSEQICANHDVVTTCEEVDFPNKEAYTCGCIDSRCIWYR